LNAQRTQLHVETVGAGAPLVLLHGLAMDGGIFGPLLPALSRRHRVHVVDLPGHGWSQSLKPYSLPALAAAVDRATASVDGPMTVVGWSLGGSVAMQWAADNPERVRRLVLVAATPSLVARADWPHAMSPQTLARFGDELRVAWRLTLERFLALQLRGSEEGRRALALLRPRLFERGEPSRETLDDAVLMLQQADLRPLAPAIRAPALVVGGERDALVPLAATQALAALLPNATHRTIEGAAHAPFLSHSGAFLAALDAFGDG
jgi:pimeloyl-[acyl-carrier protein] methyl ester esterase